MDDWDRDCEQAIEELWQDIRTAAEARALRTMLPALRQVLAVTFQEGADDARISALPDIMTLPPDQVVSPDQVRAVIQYKKFTRIPHHKCGICGYPTGFRIDGDFVAFDSGCDCTGGGYEARVSSFAELAKEFNIQKPDVRARPVWLNPGETFAVSGGVGFSGGEQAIGATGVVRIEGSTSAFAGAAVTTDGKWSGKAGVRIGW